MAKDSLLSPPPKAIIFDLMGTCLNWHTSILPTLLACCAEQTGGFSSASSKLNEQLMSEFALQWREGFFTETYQRFVNEPELPPEDIDVTHRRVLDRLLAERGRMGSWSDEQREKCVKAWHSQTAWADVPEALERLRSKFDVCVLANGTTRLQIDITKSAGLDFDMMFSSQLLGLTKPDSRIYQMVAEDLLGHRPEDCLMVAAHAYDLRAAKKLGMQTVYVQRWTEDRDEFTETVKQENDLYIEEDVGLTGLSDVLGV